MEAKAVPRPDPPQYAPLWQNVQRFLVGLGSVDRIVSLMTRLKVQFCAWLIVSEWFDDGRIQASCVKLLLAGL